LHILTGLKIVSFVGLDVVLSICLVIVLYKHIKIEKITWRSYLLYSLIVLNFVVLAGLDLAFSGWKLPLLSAAFTVLTVTSALIHYIYKIPSVSNSLLHLVK